MEQEDAWHLTSRLPHEMGRGDPFAAAIRATRMPMVISDPRQTDNPIVFANDAFLSLTGYSREELTGRNCRLLQGPETSREAVADIRSAIDEGRDLHVDILNYRKDGSTFWNSLYISPVRSAAGEIQFFFASQLDVTPRIELQDRLSSENARIEAEVGRRTRDLEEALAAKTMLLHEVDHRVKNNLQMVASLISLQARRIPDAGIKRSLKAMLERVEALSTVHRQLYQADDVSRFDVSEFVRDISQDLVASTGREDIALTLDLETVAVPAAKAAPIALLVNEAVTNALKHAFPERPGSIAIRVRRDGDRCIIAIADDGVGMPATIDGRKSLGTALNDNFGQQLQAVIDWPRDRPGTQIRIALPIEHVRLEA